MPAYIFDDFAQIEFGEGDIVLVSGIKDEPDEKVVSMSIFESPEKHPLGPLAPISDECVLDTDLPLGQLVGRLTFDNQQSIDVVIRVLMECKEFLEKMEDEDVIWRIKK